MKKEVMLSSSLRGTQMKALRDAAKAGIERARLAVSACEPWPALTIGAFEASLALVREADYYLLVSAGRYGSPIGNGDNRSFTEAEFDEAMKAAAVGVKRLAFFEEPVTMETLGSPLEQAEQFRKLLEFREKVKNSGITPITFRTPDELKHEVERALLHSILNDGEGSISRPHNERGRPRERFHIVHEYSLLETSLAGRAAPLSMLSQWATGRKPIMVIESFGGFGKSALTWWWWELQKPQEHWSKGLWFTFSELSSTAHEFFAQLYSHLADEPLDDSLARSNEELARETLKLCREQPYLIALDGFERTLPIMDGIDANAERPEEESPATRAGGPSNKQQDRGLRSINNKLLAEWLVRVTNNSKARVLITTRYMPANLENVAGNPRRNVEYLKLDGLSLAEAREYWDLLGLDPDDPGLERVVMGVHGHPLTLQVMAGTLRNSGRRSLADFFRHKPDFEMFGPQDGRDDVFAYALDHISAKSRTLLETIALWPLPVPLQDLSQLTCAGNRLDTFGSYDKPFSEAEEFVEAILGLEERRLISRNANNCADMHPVMRDVVRQRTSAEARNLAHGRIVEEFTKRRRLSFSNAKSIEEIAALIQLIISAARINRWDVAIETYAFRVRPQLQRLNYRKITGELLAEFFIKTEIENDASVIWKNPVPYFKSPPNNKRDDQYFREHGLSPAETLQFMARQDFAQDAANAHLSLGKYAIAAAFFREHNRTCSEPLCRTKQMSCFQQQGKFGHAADIPHECLVDLDVGKIKPREKARLTDTLFDDCIERKRVEDARTAAARRIKLLKTWPGEARTSDSEGGQLRHLNLMLARLAVFEDLPSAAIAITREVVENARNDGHRKDEVAALRTLAWSLRADRRLEEAADAYDLVLALDPDRDHDGGLDDRASRARNLIDLSQFDVAADELNTVLERTRGAALSTHAIALIYRAELEAALGKPAAVQKKTLRTALDIYSMYPGTPIDCYGVRTCLAKLRSLNAITDADVARKQFREPVIWPGDLLAGTDEARVTGKDKDFALAAVWSLSS